MPRLLGYKKFTSKAGKKTCVAVVALPPTQFEIDKYGFVGENVRDNVFMPDSQIDLLTPSDIGKELEFSYEVDTYGKSHLSKITVKR